MAIANVFKQFNVQRDNGTWVFASNSSGTIRQDLAASAATGDLVDQALANTIVAKRDAAQGNAAELDEVLGLIG